MFSRQTCFHTMFLCRKPGFMGSVSRDGYKLFVIRVCFCFWILTDLRHVLKDQWHRENVLQYLTLICLLVVSL
jgi:hypothetical protein